jgi:LacI family transcriptional regulator
MRDVAALAGVSLKTVSRVINGMPSVDPALTNQVRRAAALLNYKPNLAASSLRRRDGRSMMIGLMLEDIANPYSSIIYRAAENVARGLGVGVLAGSIEEDPERERELAAALIVRRVDGLLIVPAGQDHSYLVNEMGMGTAVVFVDRPPRYLAADAVVSDNRAGTAKGVRHLIELGHRRIAYLGDLSSIATAQERFAGFEDALREASLGLDYRLVRHDLHTIDAATAAAAELLAGSSPPTALFSGQNLVTIGTVRALRAAGLQHRTALIGFDDFPLADLLEPGITVIAQDPASIGKLGTEILFQRIHGDTSPVKEHVVPTRLIERDSGAIPPPDAREPVTLPVCAATAGARWGLIYRPRPLIHCRPHR